MANVVKGVKEISFVEAMKYEPQRQTLQELANKLAFKYSTHLVLVTLCHFENDKVIGKCDMVNGRIYISVDACYADKVTAVYHEYRHYWQACHPIYSDILLFWMNSGDAYYTLYETEVVATEADAVHFANTFGMEGREDLLNKYNVQYLERLFKRMSVSAVLWLYPKY